VGQFEDDDYAVRAREAGYRIVCARDAFVHHFGNASFSKLGVQRNREIFEENRRRFEEKWHQPYTPPRTRRPPAGELRDAFRRLLRRRGWLVT
jgi:GT2 family glycosyltransferase